MSGTPSRTFKTTLQSCALIWNSCLLDWLFAAQRLCPLSFSRLPELLHLCTLNTSFTHWSYDLEQDSQLVDLLHLLDFLILSRISTIKPMRLAVHYWRLTWRKRSNLPVRLSDLKCRLTGPWQTRRKVSIARERVAGDHHNDWEGHGIVSNGTSIGHEKSVSKAPKCMLGTIVENYSEDTDPKLQLPSEPVKKSFEMTRILGRVLVDLPVMREADVNLIVETSIVKSIDSLQSEIPESVESTFENSIQSSYSNSNTSRKTAIFCVGEEAPGEFIPSACGLTVREAEIGLFNKTSPLAKLSWKRFCPVQYSYYWS